MKLLPRRPAAPVLSLPVDVVATHHLDLVERHEVSVELLPPDLTDYQHASIASQTRAAALDYLEREGLAATVTHFERRDPHTLGVEFTVTVARASATPAGGVFGWRWSNRWRSWADKLSALRRAEKQAPKHPIVVSQTEAEVITLRAPEDIS